MRLPAATIDRRTGQVTGPTGMAHLRKTEIDLVTYLYDEGPASASQLAQRVFNRSDRASRNLVHKRLSNARAKLRQVSRGADLIERTSIGYFLRTHGTTTVANSGKRFAGTTKRDLVQTNSAIIQHHRARVNLSLPLRRFASCVTEQPERVAQDELGLPSGILSKPLAIAVLVMAAVACGAAEPEDETHTVASALGPDTLWISAVFNGHTYWF